MQYRGWWLCCLLFLLPACRLGPRYQPPEVAVPGAWKSKQETATSPFYSDYWWDIFADPLLDHLEKSSIQNSPNLAVAYQKVVQARGQAKVARSRLFPQIFLSPSYNDQGVLLKNYFSPLLATSAPFTPFPSSLRVHEYQISLPLDMSYEFDLWGKLQGEYDSLKKNSQAEAEAYQVVLLNLTASIASTYFQIRGLDTALQVYREMITSYTHNLNLAQERFNGGIVTILDVSQAKLQLANTQAQYQETLRQRVVQEDLLATLVGTPASEFSLPSLPLESLPPLVPAGLPSDVLMQRPDIAEAERQMASEHDRIGVAYASYYPSLSLTTAAGFLSPIFKEFLRGISRYWQWGLTANEAIFDGGKRNADVVIAYAKFREASGNYKQTILQAFQEVEDALSNLEKLALEYDALQEAMASATTSYQITMQQNLRGLVNYLNVTQSEIALQNARIHFIKIWASRYQSTVDLIKALGGGWQCP